MWALSLSAIATLVLSAAECSAFPVESSRLVTRSQCGNAPDTVAGTHLGRRNIITAQFPPPAHSRALTTGTWCAPNSQIYVVVTIIQNVAGAAVQNLLDDAYRTVSTHVLIHGDGLIDGGHFSWLGPAGLMLNTANANNHQQTWGVLGAALSALGNYMHHSRNGAGTAIFSIFDGMNMVGTGSIR